MELNITNGTWKHNLSKRSFKKVHTQHLVYTTTVQWVMTGHEDLSVIPGLSSLKCNFYRAFLRKICDVVYMS